MLSPHRLQNAAHVDPVAYAVDLMRGTPVGSSFLRVTVPVTFIVVTSWLATRIFTTGEDA